MKKAQSAMEYLMTYGWAILIVIIVAAALYALGIFNPATYTGRIATGFTTLGTPDDWDVDSNGNVQMILNNRLSDQITIHSIEATLGSTSDTYNTDNCTGAETSGGGDPDYMQIAPGGEADPSQVCTGASNPYSLDVGSPTTGTTYSVNIEMSYNSGGFNHTETGTLTGTVSQA